MPINDLFTPAERRLAVLLLVLTLLGYTWRLGTRVSPEVAAWLEGETGPVGRDSLRSPPPSVRVETGAESSGPVGWERPATSTREAAGPAPSSERLVVDVNRVGFEGLLTLPGVGPVLARRILEDRDRNGPYRTAEDLLRVPGIGPATLARVRPHLRVEPPPGRLK